MPAQHGRRRPLSAGIALLAIILGGAVLGPHAASTRPGSTRAVVTSTQAASPGGARAVEVHSDLRHSAVVPHADLSTPPAQPVALDSPGRSGAVVAALVADPSLTVTAHRGRAPPRA